MGAIYSETSTTAGQSTDLTRRKKDHELGSLARPTDVSSSVRKTKFTGSEKILFGELLQRRRHSSCCSAGHFSAC